MNTTKEHNEKIAKMIFASVFPYYVEKVEKKGRTKKELFEVIYWLTNYSERDIEKIIENKTTFKDFFNNANLNKNAHLITGTICGYRIEDIENSITKQVRYLDKLIDELAKGKKMEKILRNS